MKGLFKLTTAALALVAFASCNNDDIFTPSKNAANQPGLSIVSIEEPVVEGAFTRSAMDKDVNTMTYWDEDDVINVYDADLYKSDPYTYDATAKKFVGTASNVTTPAFGIYPKASVFGTSNLDDALKLRMDIPSAIEYTVDTEATIDGKTVFASNLPLWSPATKGADGVELTKLRYLTAVLKVWLPNVPGNINYMVIKSKKHNISGAFTAVLDTENPDAVQLEEKVKGDAQQDYIFVDLTKVPSNMSVVYLPIIAGTYEAGDLAIYANNVATPLTEADAEGDPTTAPFTTNWQAIRDFDTGVTLKRAGFYNVKVTEDAYPQKAENPVQMTHLLDLYKTNDVLEIATKNFTVDKNTATVGNIIEIPEVTTTEPVVIDIQADGTVTTTTNDLTIQNAKDVDFDGTLIFKSNNATVHPDLTVNLPNADVIIGGTYTGTVEIKAAKSVTLGDGNLAAATSIATFSLGASAPYGKITNSLTINDNATVSGAIDLETAGVAGSKDFVLNIKGKATDATTGIKANLATVNMTGWTNAAGKAQAAQVTTLTTKGGDVTIALPTEGEAITTALNMYAANTNLILKQGYVKALAATASTAIANQKNLEVNINNEGQGLVAFGSITSDGNAEINLTESPYVGDFNSITKADSDPYKAAYEYPNVLTIYTAQQLAVLNGKYASSTHNVTFTTTPTGSGDIKLANSIDMKGAQWWGIKPTIEFTFKGYDPSGNTPTAQTIKNIDFFAQAMTDKDDAAITTLVKRGFFAETTKTLGVEKVNFTGVKGAMAYVYNKDDAKKLRTLASLGAVVGEAGDDVTLTDVSVAITGDFGITSITGNTGTTAADCKTYIQTTNLPNVGGLIGKSAGAVTITNGQVTGAAIKGYGPIGGLVGFLAADKALTVQKNGDGTKSSAKFTSYAIAYTSGDNSDFNYVKNGAVLGSLGVATGATTISIDDNTAANWTYTFTNPGRSYVANTVAEVTNEYDFTRDGVNLIGYFGHLKANGTNLTFSVAGKTAKIMGADELNTYVTAATPSYASLAKWKEANTNTLVLYYFPKAAN